MTFRVSKLRVVKGKSELEKVAEVIAESFMIVDSEGSYDMGIGFFDDGWFGGKQIAFFPGCDWIIELV